MRTVIKRLEITHFEQLQLIQDEQLSSLTIANQSLAGSTVQSSTYTSVAFSSCVFYGCTFKSVTFKNCTFNGCNFEFSHMYDCHFENCSFIDCSWMASTTRQSHFVDCELDHTLSSMTETHNNVLHFTFAETERAKEVHSLLAAAFVAA